jgi:putative hydrolase of the HAD superfamily
MPTTADILYRLSRPLEPQPTGETPRLAKLADVRVVLFDIYGTLVISGSGDVGTSGEATRSDAFAAAVAACGLPAATSTADEANGTLVDVIREHHRRAEDSGIAHPEVSILEVWADVWNELLRRGWTTTAADEVDFARLAVEFEGRANPTWPMPGLMDCLAALRSRSIELGLVSNAQFFTPELFPALVDRSLDELGFDPQLRYYSYEHRHAKPSAEMYRLAAETLASRGVSPSEVVFVGNDLRNDVMPAAATGFRTVLFAGDARSLRWRENDPSCAGVEPDEVITELAQLPGICT